MKMFVVSDIKVEKALGTVMKWRTLFNFLIVSVNIDSVPFWPFTFSQKLSFFPLRDPLSLGGSRPNSNPFFPHLIRAVSSALKNDSETFIYPQQKKNEGGKFFDEEENENNWN